MARFDRIADLETLAMLTQAGFVQVQIVERFGIYAVVVGRKPE